MTEDTTINRVMTVREVTDADRIEFAKQSEDAKRAKLEQKLIKVMQLEKRAGTRVKRAATLLQRYQKARRRIEQQIGQAEVTRITTRLIGSK